MGRLDSQRRWPLCLNLLGQSLLLRSRPHRQRTCQSQQRSFSLAQCSQSCAFQHCECPRSSFSRFSKYFLVPVSLELRPNTLLVCPWAYFWLASLSHLCLWVQSGARSINLSRPLFVGVFAFYPDWTLCIRVRQSSVAFLVAFQWSPRIQGPVFWPWFACCELTFLFYNLNYKLFEF